MSSVFLDTIVWRNNRLEVFCENDALRNFAKFTGKHQCQWLFLNKVVDLRPANLLKKESLHAVLAQFFPIVTWGCVSLAQILWLCRLVQRQNVHCPQLHKTAESKLVLLPELSLFFFSFSFVFSKYLHYFLPFFCCIVFDVFYLYLFHI